MYDVLVGCHLSRVRWIKHVQATLSFFEDGGGRSMNGSLTFQTNIAPSVQNQVTILI